MKLDSRTVVLKNGVEVVLRSAFISDAADMLSHLKITHKESYRNLNQSAGRWDLLTVDDEAKILADFENSPGKIMLVALHENIIVGGLGMFGPMQEFVKQNLSIGMSVQKKYSNVGLGTHLMKVALAVAKANGFHRLDLTVRTYNAEGIRLYEKMGFQKIGLLKEVAFVDGQYVDEFAYQLLV